MVVDDVEDDGKPEAVSAIDETPQIVRRSVATRRRKERHAVVAPVPAAREIRDGHQLDGGDTEACQRFESVGGTSKRAFRSESADVQLVDDQPIGRNAGPAFSLP